MKLCMMAVFDSASAAFLPPFVVATPMMALRQIRDQAARQPDHDFVRHADQFTLFQVGSWDNESGDVKGCAPQSMGTMQSILAKREGGHSGEGQ